MTCHFAKLIMHFLTALLFISPLSMIILSWQLFNKIIQLILFFENTFELLPLGRNIFFLYFFLNASHCKEGLKILFHQFNDKLWIIDWKENVLFCRRRSSKRFATESDHSIVPCCWIPKNSLAYQNSIMATFPDICYGTKRKKAAGHYIFDV